MAQIKTVRFWIEKLNNITLIYNNWYSEKVGVFDKIVIYKINKEYLKCFVKYEYT